MSKKNAVGIWGGDELCELKIKYRSIPGQGIRPHMHAKTTSSRTATKESTCHN